MLFGDRVNVVAWWLLYVALFPGLSHFLFFGLLRQCYMEVERAAKTGKAWYVLSRD